MLRLDGIMSFGGSVAAMLHSIKQNAKLRRKVTDRKRLWDIKHSNGNGEVDVNAINDGIKFRKERKKQISQRSKLIWIFIFIITILYANLHN